MNKPKYTPGPWHIGGDDECPDGVPVIEIARGDCPSPEYEQIAYVQPFLDGEDFVLTDAVRANARLIAAAPDLFEALKDARKWMVGGSPQMDELAAKTDAAIAKAEGRS